jgi:hypothetical protein
MAKTPKRPRDPNQLAKLMIDLATGEAEDPQAPVVGSSGGRARAEALPKKRRVEIARKGAEARWSRAEPSSADPE